MNPNPESLTCPVSGAPMLPAFQHQVLGRYDVSYFYCEESGLLRTEPPYWKEEAYQSAIADADTGLVSRNLAHARFLETFLGMAWPNAGARFLDVAGGYGLLTRLLRDKGFDCYTSDPYCQNLLAPGFEAAPDFQADALFAFEVLEHVEDALTFVRGLFEKHGCRTLVFSTQTFTGAIPPLDWWYYGFSAGQHISFYQPRTLALLAARLGCRYYAVHSGLHVISDRSFSWLPRLMLRNKWVRRLCAPAIRLRRRGRSFTWADHPRVLALGSSPGVRPPPDILKNISSGPE